MPVRAPVKQPTNLLEGMTSKRQVLLGRFAGKEDHAPVRVGSAAMPAPFAFCHREICDKGPARWGGPNDSSFPPSARLVRLRT